mmetsp:Transcript_76699/g.152042  ORF Transcript_76699/g.152042 Transcript_76699/m.152042 type:complete len:201 (-) Transcript_76699:205-807(-)
MARVYSARGARCDIRGGGGGGGDGDGGGGGCRCHCRQCARCGCAWTSKYAMGGGCRLVSRRDPGSEQVDRLLQPERASGVAASSPTAAQQGAAARLVRVAPACRGAPSRAGQPPRHGRGQEHRRRRSWHRVHICWRAANVCLARRPDLPKFLRGAVVRNHGQDLIGPPECTKYLYTLRALPRGLHGCAVNIGLGCLDLLI